MAKTPDDIAALEKRIKRLKKTHQAAPKPRTGLPKSITSAFRIGTEFIASVFVGICMGVALDKFLGTKVIFVLVFSLFGCMAGMVNVYRSAKEMEKEIEGNED